MAEGNAERPGTRDGARAAGLLQRTKALRLCGLAAVVLESMAQAHILVIDDEPDIRALVGDILEDEGYRVSLAEHADAARAQLAAQSFDAILLDIWMPGTDGVGLLRSWKEGPGLPCPVLMMSGHGTVETAVEATRLGAWDFIEKPISLAKLLITLQRALEAGALQKSHSRLLGRMHAEVEPLGDSEVQRHLRAQLSRLARHDTPILLRGEAGTRKEALARWVHQQGGRRDGPFVTVAAGDIADERAAATLFGAETDGQVLPGLLEQAQGGTLYLDDLAALGPDPQLRLSSAIERKKFLRVGGRQPVGLDVRVIAASADDLESERAAGRLRDELYFLVSVVPVEVPPLRARKQDIPALVAHWVEHLAERDGLLRRGFSPAALDRLAAHEWPGNLRELRNLVHRLLLMGQLGQVEPTEVEQALGQVAGSTRGAGHAALQVDFELPLREAREQFERAYLQDRLQAANGSVGVLARMVGMERTHLYRKLKELGVDIRGSREG